MEFKWLENDLQRMRPLKILQYLYLRVLGFFRKKSTIDSTKVR